MRDADGVDDTKRRRNLESTRKSRIDADRRRCPRTIPIEAQSRSELRACAEPKNAVDESSGCEVVAGREELPEVLRLGAFGIGVARRLDVVSVDSDVGAGAHHVCAERMAKLDARAQ